MNWVGCLKRQTNIDSNERSIAEESKTYLYKKDYDQRAVDTKIKTCNNFDQVLFRSYSWKFI